MELAIEPITPSLGARVAIAADRVLEPGVPAQLLAALNRYNVLIFPQIAMPDETFAALTAAMGEKHALSVTADRSAASDKGIYRIALDKDDKTQLDYVKGNDYWHMDGTVYDTPGKATLLKCECPPRTGGDTEFANLYAAWEAMPPALKQRIAGKRIVHCLEAVGRKFRPDPSDEDLARWHRVFPPTEHPLVWHQRDGRTSLVIGSTAQGIVGMTPEAGTALIEELLDWCTAPPFTYRHQWQQGDLVIFNNPGLLHRSHPYDDASGRVLHRTTLKGHEAFA